MGNLVITFYSYKGGVGRSMTMANIAVILAQWGFKTLVIDWDLEAPGLENFYRNYINTAVVTEKKGLIDLMTLKANDPGTVVDEIKWDEYISHIDIGKDLRLDIITAGKRDDDYIKKVKQLDYTDFYQNADGGQYLEDLREYWLQHYNFILIDSRTGLTDSSGICSIHMPDVLVLLFTPNEQSFNGVKNVAKKAIQGQKKIIYDRFRLRTLPVPSRIEYQETGLLDEWMKRIYDQSSDMLEWLPKKGDKLSETIITPAQLINQIKIPYRTFYAYGEKLAVMERGSHDPQDVGYSYETIAAILANNFQNIDLLIDSRDSYVKKAKREDYTDDSDFRKRIEKEQGEKRKLEEALHEKEKKSKKKDKVINWVIAGIILAFILVIFSLQKCGNNKPDIPGETELTDSLLQRNAYLNFIKNYNATGNQYDPELNLTLIRDYYRLQKRYRDSAVNIKENIEDVIGYKFTEVVKSYYNALRTRGGDASVYYFSDTVSRFGILENTFPSVIKGRIDSIKNNKPIQNAITDTAAMTYESDSAGFYINFVEKGNFLIDKKEEYTEMENAVSVLVGYDYKIRSVTYTLLKGNPVGVIGQKMVLEIFFCQTSDKLLRKNAVDIVNALEKTDKYKIYTRNNFSIPSDAASPYYITSNEIRYNGKELEEAGKIQKIISGVAKMNTSLRPTRTITPNYLSIFICFGLDEKNADTRQQYLKK